MRIKKLNNLILIALLLTSILFSQPLSTFAYTTGMDASVVIGQADFTTASANQGGSAGANTLSAPRWMTSDGTRLIVADSNNNRVLIYNQLPTSNNASADVVIGQPNMTSVSANQGGSAAANTLSSPQGVTTDGSRLLISDQNNHRVLIYNQIPTSNNASADVVIGQTSMTGNSSNQGGSCAANTLDGPQGISYDPASGKLLVAQPNDNGRRLFIYNHIPTSNNASADVVVGKPDFVSCSSSAATSTNIARPRDGKIYNGKLIVADSQVSRVMIYNSVPTTNGAAADVVIGQPSFTASGCGAVSAKNICGINEAVFDGRRLFIPDTFYSRVLVYNGIPTSNYAAANLVLGQANFTSDSANRGGNPAANTMNLAVQAFIFGDKLLIAEISNNRILIFENIINNPVLTLDNNTEIRENGLIRFTGTAKLPATSSYTIPTIQYSVNNGEFKGVTAVDGNVDSLEEAFYFDVDPASNQPRDADGNLIDGYTVRVKSINTNLDETDYLFYFSPFTLNSPANNTTVTSIYPTFDFSVVKQNVVLHDNLDRYQIQIKRGGEATDTWETLIDDIPIDGVLDETGAISVDNNDFKAIYTDDASRIKVTSKTNGITGSFQWKAVAVDKSGHAQDSEVFSLKSNARVTNPAGLHFPLAILNISGLGNPFISTSYAEGVKEMYLVRSTSPVIYGIAFANSQIDLTLTDQNCVENCSKLYSTVANEESRFGINIPQGDLIRGKKYTVNMVVRKGSNFNELPSFTIQVI